MESIPIIQFDIIISFKDALLQKNGPWQKSPKNFDILKGKKGLQFFNKLFGKEEVKRGQEKSVNFGPPSSGKTCIDLKTRDLDNFSRRKKACLVFG